jgi:DNA-cytosine methyltransferase
MKVVSLFDGIRTGRYALESINVSPEKYFFSEIDRDAIKVGDRHYPDSISLGDVTKIRAKRDIGKIDLLIGGSPCQGFSNAGGRLNFDDPRSKLFWQFVRILDETGPSFFLFENVKMRKEEQKIISSHLGVEPIILNSNTLSAQHRERLYWTNLNVRWGYEDKSPLNVIDIVEENPKAEVIMKKRGDLFMPTKKYHDRFFVPASKHNSPNGLVFLGGIMKEGMEMWGSKKMLQRDFRQGVRVYDSNGKSPTLNAKSGGIAGKSGLFLIGDEIRRLSVTECCRLQTMPDDYMEGVSYDKAISLLGNGWTADVIIEILKNMPR